MFLPAQDDAAAAAATQAAKRQRLSHAAQLEDERTARVRALVSKVRFQCGRVCGGQTQGLWERLGEVGAGDCVGQLEDARTARSVSWVGDLHEYPPSALCSKPQATQCQAGPPPCIPPCPFAQAAEALALVGPLAPQFHSQPITLSPPPTGCGGAGAAGPAGHAQPGPPGVTAG